MLNETLFHNANGYLGVRSNYEEGYPEGYQTIRGEYINGFYDYADMKQAEKLYGLVEEKQTMPNLVDTQGIRLWIEDEEFSMFQGSVIKSTRTLDMRRGVTQRYLIWKSPHGRKIEIKIRRMASFLLLPLFTIEYSVRPLNFSGKLHIRSTHIGNVKNYFDTHDPRLAGDADQHIIPGKAEYLDGISIIFSRTLKSDLSVTSAVKNILSVPAQREYKLHGSTISEEFYIEGVCENSLQLTKYTVLCDSIRYPNCRKAALECIDQAVSVPLAVWYEKQENYLNGYWKNCALHIRGDRELSIAITYNLYQLIQSVGKDSHCSIAAKGLSGEGYEGHYFWDTEMFLLPFYSLTMPELARNLIEYRYATLDFARENARILGHQSGALFPWRTIMGKECSGYFPAGSAQYHINGAIAYSIINYYLLTNDLEFIEKCGAEIVFETARLWIDLGNYSNGKFVMNDVTGPDEYTCIVNNNYYTNLLAQFNLVWAVKLYKTLREAGKMETIQQKLQLRQHRTKHVRV
jgi:alpha,alpha-trehalose phosphorylase